MDNTEQRDFAEEAANRALLHEEDEADFTDYREDYGGAYETDDHAHDPRKCRECSEKYGTVYMGKSLPDWMYGDKPEQTGPKVWIFTSTSGDAYDTTQTFDGIRDGDVLIVPKEGIVGVMVKAWPCALTSEFGDFHQPRDITDVLRTKYNDSVNLANEYISRTRDESNYLMLSTDVLRERHGII